MEIIDENSDHDDDNVDHETPRIDSLCPSGYPPEELMERFAEIVKGRTYLHRPNQSLNLYLTATLAIAVAVVIGLGFGHFKGKKNIQNDTTKNSEVSTKLAQFVDRI